jgi:hypothetical protein
MVAEKLGLIAVGGSYKSVQRRIRHLDLDTSHFRSRPWERRDRTKSPHWSDEELRNAVAISRSYAQAISKLGLVPAGGNYDQVRRRVHELQLDTTHFQGQAWNKGGMFRPRVAIPLSEILVANRWTGTHILKKRLLREGLKIAACELCGWAERSLDGRIPIELDHINGDRNDNRLENLRILCPNCHALQPTHRGLNKKSRRA